MRWAVTKRPESRIQVVLSSLEHTGASDSHTGASDSESLERTARDPEAFGLFYDRFEREVLGFFYRATRRADIAADLTAEVFASALAWSRWR